MRLRCSASKCDSCFIHQDPEVTAQRGRDGANTVIGKAAHYPLIVLG